MLPLNMPQIKRLTVRGFLMLTICIFIRIIPVMLIKLYLLFFMRWALRILAIWKIHLLLKVRLQMVGLRLVNLMINLCFVAVMVFPVEAAISVVLLRNNTNILITSAFDIGERSGSNPQQKIATLRARSLSGRALSLQKNLFDFIKFIIDFLFLIDYNINIKS